MPTFCPLPTSYRSILQTHLFAHSSWYENYFKLYLLLIFLPTLLFYIVLTQVCRTWNCNEHGINLWHMITLQVNETVCFYISHRLIMDCTVNISINMDTVNYFWGKFLCIQFSPYATLMYCWCSEYELWVSTPGPQNLSVFPYKAFVFICHNIQSACFWSMVSLLTVHTRTDTEW